MMLVGMWHIYRNKNSIYMPCDQNHFLVRTERRTQDHVSTRHIGTHIDVCICTEYMSIYLSNLSNQDLFQKPQSIQETSTVPHHDPSNR